jgi:ParB family chromosome partitioning protein
LLDTGNLTSALSDMDRGATVALLSHARHIELASTTIKNSVNDELNSASKSISHIFFARVSEVKIKTRLRATNQENVADIAASIREIGLINPILIDSEINLIAGYHRLLAFKFLGLKEIPAIISSQQALKSQLQEIDENLKRAELTSIEKSVHIQQREDILRQLDQMAVKGDNRFSSTNKSTQKQRASEIGMSRRNYQYHKELENLHPEVKELLNDTAYANRLTDLVILARENDDIQLKVAKSLITGKSYSIKRALVMEKTKANRIASPYQEGLPNFKERYGEIPKSIMHMGRPTEEGLKTLWDLSANNEDLRKAKWITLFGAMTIRLYSWNPNHCAFLIDYYTRVGDTILDPFVGRGSTAIAAVMLKRNFVGIDLLPDAANHNQQVLEEYIDIPEVEWDIRCEDGIELRSLISSGMQIDGVITDPPYYENSEVYSDNPFDLSRMKRGIYLERISVFFANLRTIVKPSNIGGENRIYPVIVKVGSYRRGKSGLIDMAIDYQIIAERCGWVLWDKSFISLNTAMQSVGFQRNYLHGYVTKNYETILVFAWFQD